MKQILTLIIGLASLQLTAQTSLNFHSEMFDNLDTSKLSTNILANKAGIPDTLFNFDGTTNCDTSSLALWQFAYNTLYVGDVTTSSMPHPDTIMNQVPDDASSEIKINAVYFNYNYLVDNAVSSGVIHLSDTLFYDGPNSGNPYQEETCFVVAPMYPYLLPLDITFRVGTIYGNLTSNISSASINFGDGNGYVSFVANTQYNIDYNSAGTYYITLRLTLTNSSLVYARSSVTVTGKDITLKSATIVDFPDDYPCENQTPGIVPNENFTYQISRSGENNDGIIKVWYGYDENGTIKTSLTKPIVLVDGFDPVPLDSMDRAAEEIYFETNFNAHYENYGCTEISGEDRMNSISEGLLDRLRNLGYDIAIVDFEWGGNDILVNAETLEQGITYLNSLLSQNGSNEQLVVMGPSMGALIARIALSEMTNHNTKLYVSFDGPHQGAYIPMPLQRLYGTALEEANDALVVSSGILSILGYGAPALWLVGAGLLTFQVYMNGVLRDYSPLDCPAAQQMLMYHYLGTSNNSAFSPDADHTTLYNSIAGEYPQNCKNVAISCGDGNGTTQTTFSGITQGSDYLNYSFGNKIKCKIEFKELPDNNTLSPYLKFNVYSEKWGIKFNYFNKTYHSITSSSSRSYERRPGGNFNSNNMLFGYVDKKFIYDQYECFMPLSTSLDLASGVTNNIFTEFGIPSGRNFTINNYTAKSPFDMIYVQNENRFHVLRGPQPEEGTSSLPGLTQDMTDFFVWLVEEVDNIDGLTQQETYHLYDIFMAGGTQTCSQPFKVAWLESGSVSKSYNSSAVTISNANITGDDKNIEVYSESSITIGANTFIGDGASIHIGPGDCGD